jgi:uncharacterized DUF497 family protein
MEIEFVGFDWDDGNTAKCAKHGVSREEIESAFRGTAFLLAPDEKHSGAEERFIAVARASRGRNLFVAFTLRKSRAGTLIRPISARHMHRKEVRRYEQESSAPSHRRGGGEVS